jgi:hypothetical protein
MWPAYVVRPFEPAFMSAPTFAVLPYSPATIAAVTPVYAPGNAAMTPVHAPQDPPAEVELVNPALRSTLGTRPVASPAETVVPGAWPGNIPGVGFGFAPCGGCCGKAYSPLPPNAVQAFGPTLGCGGGCSSCRRFWF